MAEQKRKTDARPRSSGRSEKTDASAQTIELHRKNWMLLSAGFVCILLGFLVLSLGNTTLAPILLLSGYLVLVPWGLVAHRKTVPVTIPDERHKS